MRVKWIDSWRGILISLVVVGHTLGMSYHFATSDVQKALSECYKLVYCFHMPAFFVLAGVLWSNNSKDFGVYLLKKIKRLVVPYLFWGGLSALVYVIGRFYVNSLFGGATTDAYVGKGLEMWWRPFVSILHGGGWPNGDGFQCNSVLWFLPVMFSVQLLFWWMRKFALRISPLLLLFLLSFPIGFFSQNIMQYLPWGLGRAFYYLPYFIVGRIFGNFVGTDVVGKSRVRNTLLLLVSFSVYASTCLFTPNMSVAHSSWFWYVVFAGVAILGSLGSAISACIFDCSLLQAVGKSSLVIMLLHKFVILALLNLLPIARSIKNLGLVCVLAVIAAVSLAAIVVCKYGHCLLNRLAPKLIGEWR